MRFTRLIIPPLPSVSIFELGRIVFVLSLRLHCFLQVGIRIVSGGGRCVCVGVCVRFASRGKKVKNTCLITLISISGFVK